MVQTRGMVCLGALSSPVVCRRDRDRRVSQFHLDLPRLSFEITGSPVYKQVLKAFWSPLDYLQGPTALPLTLVPREGM